MPVLSWTLPELGCPPLRERLRRYMEGLMGDRSEEVEFIVLFGSAARGEARPGSDLDLLIGLRSDGREPFLERLRAFSDYAPGVDAFAYYPGELREMFRQLHPTLLEASDHGKVLWDRGTWGELKGVITRWVQCGKLAKRPRGWQVVDPELLRGPEPT